MRRGLAILAVALLLWHGPGVAPAEGHVLNRTIAASGGCPQLNRFDTITPGKSVQRRWSTSLATSIVTSVQTPQSAREAEVERAINESFSVWTSVTGTTLNTNPGALGALTRTSTQQACNFSDGINTICFNQSDSAFTTGVLAFARVVSSDMAGERVGASPPAAFIGEILDADIQFRPRDTSNFTFATPGALGGSPSSFDLETVLIHEMGHTLGFSHSSVWRAMMWPFAPPRGTFLGDRPTPQAPDGPLADDDRTGLRVLYPDPNDTVNVGTISGRVLPANPLSLATLPAPSSGRSVTGIFGTQVVAVDATTGAVIAGTLGGWSCDPVDLPTRFDGFYTLERLPLGRSYKIYVEPLDGPTDAGDIGPALSALCRSGTNNTCTVPGVNTDFTTKVRP